MIELTLNTPSGTSTIHCGEGAFSQFAPKIEGRKFIVTDTNVNKLYSQLIEKTFEGAPVFVLPAGEKSKTLSKLTCILIAMADAGLKRDCTVVALGGGVIGDIAGLAASLYMRGIKLVQIPTTLLAQVDSSVGGKTAVDFKNIKNLIGAFYQPQEVIVDPMFLKTLPKREIRCGLGEIIKYGALDKNIYNTLLNCKDLFDLDFLGSIVPDCIRHKVEVVTADERDLNGKRKALNVGHTTGHALELYYRTKSHGEFVLIGMYFEMHIAQKLNVGGGEYYDNLRKLIKKVIKIPEYSDIESAAKFALMDKKNHGDTISMMVPKIEGESTEITLNFEKYVQLLKEVI